MVHNAPYRTLLLAVVMALTPLGAYQDVSIGAQEPARAGATFSLDEMLMVQDFFRGRGAANRPILESMERQITPAARQSLKVGAILHGELRRIAKPLPSALESTLPPPLPGMRRQVAGLNVLLTDRSARVCDMLRISFDAPKAAAPKTTKK